MLGNVDKKKFSILIVVMIAGVATIYFSAVDPFFRARSFDATSWKDGDVRTRGEMIQDLIEGPYLKGKSDEEVVALLGEGREEDGVILYTIDMGVRIGFNPSLFEFALFFNKAGRIIDYEIVEPGKPLKTP